MRISDWSSDVCSSDLQARMPIGIRCRKVFDLRAAVRRHHNHRADYRDSIISEKRSGEDEPDRKSDVEGKGVSVRVDPGGRRILKKKISIGARRASRLQTADNKQINSA